MWCPVLLWNRIDLWEEILVLELPDHEYDGGEDGAGEGEEPLVMAEQQVEAQHKRQDHAHVDQQELKPGKLYFLT